MHCIDTLELTVASEALLQDLNGDLDSWTCRELVPLIDEIMSVELGRVMHAVPTLPTVKIHHLQLSLAVTTTAEFKQRFRERFAEELRAAIGYVLHCSRQSGANAQPAVDNTEAADMAPPYQRILQRVFSGGGRVRCDYLAMNELQTHWQDWCRAYGPRLRVELLFALRRAEHRELVAHYFPAGLQQALIALLEPCHASFIWQFIHGLAVATEMSFSSEPVIGEAADTSVGMTAQDVRPHLVAFSLAYIACERGSRFNQKMYMRSVLRQMAHHHNLCTEDLSHQLLLVVHSVAIPSMLKSAFVEILSADTAAAQGGEAATAANQPGSKPVPDELAVHRALRHVKAGLSHAQGTESAGDELASPLRRLLEQAPERLRQLLLTLAKNGSQRLMVERLAVCASDSQALLCQALNPVLFRRLKHYIAILRKCLPGTSLAVTDLNRAVLDLFLGAAKSPTGADDVYRFSQRLVPALALRTGVSEFAVSRELQRAIRRCVGAGQPGWDLLAGLNRWQTLLAVDRDSLPTASADSPEPAQYATYIASLQQGKWTIADSHWQTLYRKNPAYLRSLTRLLLQSAQYRRTLVVNIPLVVQRQLVTLLEPEAGDDLLQLWQSAHGFAKVICRVGTLAPRRPASPWQGVSEQGAFIVLREFTFAYLVLERGSEFNKRSYARSLLRQLSARYNVDYALMLGRIAQLVNDSALPVFLRQQWLAIAGFSSKPVAISPDATDNLVQGAECFYELLQALSVGSPCNQARVMGLLRYLTRQQPLFLKRLLAMMLDNQLSPAILAERLTAETLLCLLECVFQVKGYSANNFTALKQALMRSAANCADGKVFYLLILRDLLAGQVMDLDAAAELAKRRNLRSFAQTPECTPEPVLQLQGAPVIGRAADTVTPVTVPAQKKPRTNLADEIARLKRGEQKDSGKQRILYPIGQILRLLLAQCERLLMSMEQPWAERLTSSRCLSEQQWLALLFHAMERQLGTAGPVSTDAFIQNVIAGVFRCWALDRTHFDMNGFIAWCSQQLLAGGYSSQQAVNRELVASLRSLTAADIGMLGRVTVPLNLLPTGASIASPERPEQTLPVLGAGLVVLAPYLAVLFERLQLLDNQALIPSARGRAMQVLYYLCWGQQTPQPLSPPEWRLFRVFCGLAATDVVTPEPIDESTQGQCDALLVAVIGHWRALGATSPTGLRETFLQRSGNIRYVPDKGWMLTVDSQAFDVLLDRLPWRFSVIKYAFMEDALHVHWR